MIITCYTEMYVASDTTLILPERKDPNEIKIPILIRSSSSSREHKNSIA